VLLVWIGGVLVIMGRQLCERESSIACMFGKARLQSCQKIGYDFCLCTVKKV
jgi:hypothetical protein